MERYHPQFESPYPDPGWKRITDFRYETPLVLRREIEAVRGRDGDRDADYIVGEPYTVGYELDGERRTITVPRGMLTDLTSVPSLARSAVGRVGPHLEAAIVHDFLYVAWNYLEGRGPRDEDRRFADDLMRVAMDRAKVGGFKQQLIHGVVRAFGSSAFRQRRSDRFVVL